MIIIVNKMTEQLDYNQLHEQAGILQHVQMVYLLIHTHKNEYKMPQTWHLNTSILFLCIAKPNIDILKYKYKNHATLKIFDNVKITIKRRLRKKDKISTKKKEKKKKELKNNYVPQYKKKYSSQ